MSTTSSLFDSDIADPLVDVIDVLTQANELVDSASNGEEGNVPEGWVIAPIRDLMDLVNGFAFKPSDWSPNGLPIIRIQNLNNPNASFNYYRGELADKLKIKKNDLLFAWSGTPGTSFGAHLWYGDNAWLNQHIFRVILPELLLDKQFIRYAINQNLQGYIEQAQGGVGLAHITKGKFEASPIYLPPLAEQQRIVEAIEAALTHVNIARESLARVSQILKRFRQSVLAAACSGRLTADWREANPHVEPASVLLEQIHAERKAKDGKKYKYPAPIDASELEELPENWEWCQPETITSSNKYSLAIGPFGSNLKVADYTDQGVPLIFVRNIRSASFIDTKTKYVSIQKAKELLPHLASQGDILITKMGDPPGDACIYPSGNPDAVITADCIKWTINPQVGINAFFAHLVNSEIVKRQIADRTQGVAQQKISLERFKSITIPLPPIEEQREIVRRAERLFAIADLLEKRVASATIRVEKTTQAVLAKAFRGELVPTEAELARQEGREYEPASVLLERIKSERGVETSTKARRGRASKKG